MCLVNQLRKKIGTFTDAYVILFRQTLDTTEIEGGLRGVRKPQNRTEIRQKTANRIGFFPEYRNRTYMEAHYMS